MDNSQSTVSSDQVLASIVKKALRETPLTMQQVSDQSGIPLTTLKRRLTGNSSFTITELARIGLLCKRTPSQFLAETERRVAGAA